MSEQRKKIIDYAKGIFKAMPNLSGSEWADKHFYLSAESSALPGKFKCYPYQKDIIDAMTDIKSQTVAVKKATRIGYNKMLNISIAYFIDQQPSVILFYNPTEAEAKGVAESEIENMIRDNDRVKKLIENPNIRGRTKKERTMLKNYPGGYLEILSAESERNMNRRTARVVIGDEIDTFKKEAGKAGDTISTMMRRNQDFALKKTILGGKPISSEYNEENEENQTFSVVDYWFKQGTQEHRHLPCPHCNHYQKFMFEDMIWDKDKDINNKVIKHHPDTAHFKCKKCGQKIEHHHKRDMDINGKWVAEAKGAKKTRSFYVWAMLSYSPNVKWADIVREFLNAKNSKLKLKVFYNEVLAKTWEEDYIKVDIDNYNDKLEEYAAQVPNDVLILSAGIDTQDDRLECEVVGWCKDERSYSIEYKIFQGDTTKPEVWKILDEYLLKNFYHENGGTMKIYCCAVDTGGHSTQAVYEYCKPRFSRRVFAIKGSKTLDAPVAPRLASQIMVKSGGKIPLFNIGVNLAKDVIHSHITTETVGAGYMHFPKGDNYDAEYFKQLTAEKRGSSGRWEKTRARNEALDVRVYAYSSLFIAGVDLELLSHNGALMYVAPQPKKPKNKKKDYLDEF